MAKKETVIDALFTVVDELEDNPITDERGNEFILEILYERIEELKTKEGR